MKNILILTGSPRVGGNSDLMADAFQKGAESAGHKVIRYEAGRNAILPCRACESCFSNGKACVWDDRFSNELAPLIEEADVIVLATPLYWFTFPAQLKAAIDKMYSFIIGEHGDSEIAAWSSTNVSGIPLNTFCEMRGHFDHDHAMDRIAEDVKNSAYDIISKKQATYYGIAMSVKRICECIIRNERSILPVSSMMHGEYGIDGISLSMPAIVGLTGIETHVPIALNSEEAEKLRASAETLKKIAATLEL